MSRGLMSQWLKQNGPITFLISFSAAFGNPILAFEQLTAAQECKGSTEKDPSPVCETWCLCESGILVYTFLFYISSVP